jgi:adenine deaminase
MANLIVISELSSLKIDMVFYRGRLVAKQGEPLFSPNKLGSKHLLNTVNIKPFTVEALRLMALTENKLVIEVVPDQIITKKRLEKVKITNGVIQTDTSRDILKLVVVERHRASGNIGLGLVMGFGLKYGALVSSISHDSHNIIAVGTNDEDIFRGIKEIEKLKGGLTVVADGKILSSLALPVGGLLSDEPAEIVTSKLETLETLAKSLGVKLPSAFATLSFLALPVIPQLRLTDLGLIDVNAFQLIE